ncbi:MAG: Transcriptional activator protein CzcR [Syntrophorhabdus sp. PtaU1.Bin002]|nr:MAG: Transcriptional activator protein CzcR [Syntrophorhabdus sp. PtaB.Bin006]OPY72846.1 MAG: Transcriptional activator protein CzcR [Syntrophorhabdus sp. PtaU1.Bin002]
MRVLIVEDDFTSRRLMQKFLSPYGDCDVAVNGVEAIRAFNIALGENEPYNLVCLDIMMPGVDGQGALKTMRGMERDFNVGRQDEAKIFMTTALDSAKDVLDAYYRGGCTEYLVKPIDKKKLLGLLKEHGLME